MSQLSFPLFITVFMLLCYPAYSAIVPADIRQNGFVYCVNGQVDTFNPQRASGGLVVDTLAVQLYNRLLKVNADASDLSPELAERWETDASGTLYRFYLRRGVTFHSTAWFTPSRTMNADDVVFSFSRLFDRQHPWHQVEGGYPYFAGLQYANIVQSVSKLDDYTVEIKLKRPDAAFLWHLTTPYAPILSAEYAQQLELKNQRDALDHQPVGTGPYRLDDYHSGKYVRLKRHDSYWQGRPAMLQAVIDISSGGFGRLSKLITAECDILARPAASQLSVLRDDPRTGLTVTPGANVAWLTFNTQKPPLDRREVRHALALAINNQRLIESVYYGAAEMATSVLPQTSWAYQPHWPESPYDPEQAREKLNKLGIKNLTLTLAVPSTPQIWNPGPLKMAELIQDDLAQVGVNVTINQVTGHFQKRRLMAMNYDLTLTGQTAVSHDPDSFLRPALSCAAITAQTNYSHWCHSEFDQVLAKALETEERSVRIKNYHIAQKILAAELPILPLASSSDIHAWRQSIQGMKWNRFGHLSFAEIWRKRTTGASQ